MSRCQTYCRKRRKKGKKRGGSQLVRPSVRLGERKERKQVAPNYRPKSTKGGKAVAVGLCRTNRQLRRKGGQGTSTLEAGGLRPAHDIKMSLADIESEQKVETNKITNRRNSRSN